MLRLTHVSRFYTVGDSQVVALDDVTLTITEGDYVAVVGPSGSGKSTLLQLVGLLDRPTHGTVELDGVDVGAMTDAERTRVRLHRLGFVFQRFHLLSGMTAIENVALPMEAAGIAPDERYDRATALLTSVGLEARLTFRPAQLSGGQRQRVAIARALANEPGLILADEPTGELHRDDRSAVIDLFERVHEQGRTIIVVTHDSEVAAVARRRVELRDGRVREVAA